MATPIATIRGRRCVCWNGRRASSASLGFAALLLLLPSPALAQSAASFEKHPVALGFDGMHAVEAADLDGDGDVDLLGAAMNASDIVWWENASGDGETWSLHLVADAFASARYVFATDLDTDGDLDLVGAAAIADAIAWWENTDGVAGAWTMHTVTDSFDFAMHVRSADMDGDGDPDLVAAALKADAIAWWENTDGAAGAWVEHAIDTAFNGARHVAPVDLDGDGDMDVLAAADVGDEVAWWENTDGAGTAWSKHGIEAGFDGANSAHPVDVDNDGDLDIIGSADAADQVVWWENDGNAQGWARHVIDPAFNGAFSTFPVDLDGDEDVDVVAAAAEGDLISWWENVLGDGTEWVEHPIESVFDFATHVCAVDMDGDGDRDVIGGRFGGEVNWWENTSDVPVLPVELTRFDAVASGDRVTLQWETASETGNAGFEVQRGLDGRFYPLAFVDGAGTSSEPRRYAFTVSGIEAGRHAFRLKQIDFDGGFSYSREQTVFVGVNGPYKSASVYPNPFNPNAEFTLTLGSPQHVRVEVYNTMGQRVALLHEGALDAERPYGFQFDAAGLPGGLYLFQASGERFSTTETALLVK